MIYNNLIYILVVLLVISTRTVPAEPQLLPLDTLLIFLLKGIIYARFARRAFSKNTLAQASRYFGVEQQMSILAIFFFGIDIYLLDAPYYFAKLPLAKTMPVITDWCGLLLFFGYLALLWTAARPNYQAVFGRRHSTAAFLFANLKINAALILPWFLLTLIFDLLRLAPFPTLKTFLASPWGEPLLILLFFFLLLLVFPAIIIRLWNCSPLPAGPLRQQIESFCRHRRIGYNNIMLWPLFEGRLLTAGVMGITSRFRYLLITPAMVETLTPQEIEAVIAHEVGHVKRYHLQIYLLFFLGFGLLTQIASYPFLYLILNSNLFYQAAQFAGKSPVTALTFASTASLLLLMVLYFRYLFGFFMRNFERQADLYALEAVGQAAPLIRVFEKIAWLGGKIRDLPNWHHFGIGQRIDFLRRSEAEPRLIKRHNLKVYGALTLFLIFMSAATLLLLTVPADLLEGAPKTKFAEALLEQKIREDAHNPLWHQYLGDLHFSRNQLHEARAAYEKALLIGPAQPDTLNNLAWLLLTAEDTALLDPRRALDLARQAASLSSSPHVLDTLATAYWANGDLAKALALEEQALAAHPENRAYYEGQLERFRTSSFPSPGMINQ